MELSQKFTKEQLIELVQDDIAAINSALQLNMNDAANESLQKSLAVAEIALAALMAEPVAWTDEQELRDVEKGGCGYLFTVKPVTPNADPRRVIKLYVSPPAQVMPKTLPCSVELKPGLIIGKGCKTDTLLMALQNSTTMLKGGAK
ncbi:hypothetical protein [Citrobacter werkmanii]|uniref:hypothetical protein n=1 Tax=Citrobacter werkmanii TaxID=67827 RepID=UPI00254B584A|nr:hypothetical protein [Citrobacter werkmanii]